MDLEHLTKHQIVLLTLLVSFVTSIATGIVTVSLINQAPPSITRTINQIVERTVQTVAPSSQGSTVVTTQKTIVVKDDDLIAQSIAALQKGIVRITARGREELLARGVVVDAKGTAFTDKAALDDSGATAFDAILSDGTRVPVTVIGPRATSSPVLIVAVLVGTSTAVVPVRGADLTKIHLGQSVLKVSGKGVDSVGQGVVAMLPVSGGDMIEASVGSSIPGSILATSFGELLGITTTASLVQGNDLYTILTLSSQKNSETKVVSKP